MAYNQETFDNIDSYDIVVYIDHINNILHANLPIADASRHRGGARKMNIRTLCNYLNEHNAQQIISDKFTVDGLINFVTHERNQQIRAQQIIRNADNEFFNNFNKTDYNVTDPLAELTRINAQNKFDKQRRIEQRARAVDTLKQLREQAISISHTIAKDPARLRSLYCDLDFTEEIVNELFTKNNCTILRKPKYMYYDSLITFYRNDNPNIALVAKLLDFLFKPNDRFQKK